jgi:hypothetical protein
MAPRYRRNRPKKGAHKIGKSQKPQNLHKTRRKCLKPSVTVISCIHRIIFTTSRVVPLAKPKLPGMTSPHHPKRPSANNCSKSGIFRFSQRQRGTRGCCGLPIGKVKGIASLTGHVEPLLEAIGQKHACCRKGVRGRGWIEMTGFLVRRGLGGCEAFEF